MIHTTPFTKPQLEDALEQVGIHDYDIRLDYSGRGMYGDSCFGIVTDDGSPATLGIAFFLAAISSQPLNRIDPLDEVEDVVHLADSARTDSMGLGQVIYFPGWELA